MWSQTYGPHCIDNVFYFDIIGRWLYDDKYCIHVWWYFYSLKKCSYFAVQGFFLTKIGGTVDPVLKIHTHTMTHASFKWKERREGKERGEETWRDGVPLTVELKSAIDLSLLVWLPSPWKKVRHIRLKCLLTTFYEARKCNPITVWLMSALRSAAGNDTTLKSSLGKKGKEKRTKANSRSLSNFRKSGYSATAVAKHQPKKTKCS